VEAVVLFPEVMVTDSQPSVGLPDSVAVYTKGLEVKSSLALNPINPKPAGSLAGIYLFIYLY
jgi:hypothetical protein